MNRCDLPALPYLAPWYRVAVGERRVVLEHGQRIVCFEGGAAERLLPVLLPLLDGTRTVDEIVAVLGEPLQEAVEHALGELATRDLLTEGPPLPADLSRPAAGLAELIASLRPRRASVGAELAAVASCRIAVVGSGGAGLEVARLFRVAGAEAEGVDGVEGGFNLVVCAPSPGELPRLSEWNAQALSAAQPWLQILPFDGRYAAVGPLYIPGDTACYECFRLRRGANLDAGDDLELLEAVPAGYPSAPSLDAILAGLAVQLALHWLILGDHSAPAALYSFELLPVLALDVHHVHRVPRCDACSGLADVASPLPWHKEVPVAGG